MGEAGLDPFDELLDGGGLIAGGGELGDDDEGSEGSWRDTAG